MKEKILGIILIILAGSIIGLGFYNEAVGNINEYEMLTIFLTLIVVTSALLLGLEIGKIDRLEKRLKALEEAKEAGK